MKSTRLWLIAIAGAVLAVVCICMVLGLWALKPPGAKIPVVKILSPASGTQIPLGEELLIQAQAFAKGTRLTRLQLWVDGRFIVQTRGRAPSLSATWRWRPRSPGAHTLTVQAYTEQAGVGRNSVLVHAVRVGDQAPAPEDYDGDGIPNASDACPYEAGLPEGNGCLPANLRDTDGDGVPDVSDLCPEVAGTQGNRGCPLVAGGDSDGDGIPETQDACPAEPGPAERGGCPEIRSPADGDSDGIIDSDDACPGQPGVVESPAGPGCPMPSPEDADGDGVPDAEDACPGQSGSEWNHGCPAFVDSDGDTVADSEDLCPSQSGPVENRGCPQVNSSDRDGDGVEDLSDSCPDEPGPPESNGCPSPDSDGDGFLDNEDNCPGLRGAEDGCPPWVIDFEDVARVFDPCIRFPFICTVLQGGDRDGDGLRDWRDRCPDRAGPRLNEGCPWNLGPGGSPGGRPPVCEFFPTAPVCRPIEIEEGTEEAEVEVVLGEQLHTDAPWQRVWCYLRVEDTSWFRLPLSGDSLTMAGSPDTWNTGENRRLKLTVTGQLELEMLCYGQQSPLNWPQSLGTIYRLHGPEDWTGSPFSAWSEGALNRFQVSYWMCREECP